VDDARTRARDRVLFQLKTHGPQTARQLAERLDVSAVAVRQHLADLEDESLVAFEDERRKVGRPARVWELTADAAGRFPDAHADLTVDLLESLSRTFGEDGVDKLLKTRTRKQLAQYRARMPEIDAPLPRRVAGLARIRREEGYMAEWSRADGGFLLIENHCPICAAAAVCQGLCREELSLFRRVLGSEVRVERTDHVLAGARRCAYRITPR
jgi:predicted ArsR family transcriptional regulator